MPAPLSPLIVKSAALVTLIVKKPDRAADVAGIATGYTVTFAFDRADAVRWVATDDGVRNRNSAVSLRVDAVAAAGVTAGRDDVDFSIVVYKTINTRPHRIGCGGFDMTRRKIVERVAARDDVIEIDCLVTRPGRDHRAVIIEQHAVIAILDFDCVVGGGAQHRAGIVGDVKCQRHVGSGVADAASGSGLFDRARVRDRRATLHGDRVLLLPATLSVPPLSTVPVCPAPSVCALVTVCPLVTVNDD